MNLGVIMFLYIQYVRIEYTVLACVLSAGIVADLFIGSSSLMMLVSSGISMHHEEY